MLVTPSCFVGPSCRGCRPMNIWCSGARDSHRRICRAGAAAVWGRLDKQSLENCLNMIVLALSVVMAGTGDLPTCRLLRGAPLSPRASALTCYEHRGLLLAFKHHQVAMVIPTVGTQNKASLAVPHGLASHRAVGVTLFTPKQYSSCRSPI